MPFLPKDFSKNVNYKLVCKDILIKELYIGQTTNFTIRKNKHKCNCNNTNDVKYNFKVYTFIRANGGWDNWDMIMIENFPCNDSLDACKRERYWIEKLQATLNSVVPLRTQQEWYKDNIEHIRERKQEWYEDNKEHIQKYHQEWYQENKETILEKLKEKITCECGSTCRKSDIKRHERTIKHINYIKSIA
jgi:predicted metal-dependent hydrolase